MSKAQYYINNREYLLEKAKIRNNSPEGRKATRINNWKIHNFPKKANETWDDKYDRYMRITNCERCNVVFPDDNVPYSNIKKNMTKTRGILCMSCNHATATK